MGKLIIISIIMMINSFLLSIITMSYAVISDNDNVIVIEPTVSIWETLAGGWLYGWLYGMVLFA